MQALILNHSYDDSKSLYEITPSTLTFDPYKIDLPITEVIADAQEKLLQGNTLIVNAPTGAGKSTLLPLALMHEPWLNGQKILMLEPRRLAARTIAERMASLLDEKVGQSIGYRIRFDNKVSDQTRLEVLTEGILTRMLHSDNSLEGVGMVIFDEFHERSIHADVALALCREAQQVLRPDLRIVIMSATLDMPQLTSLLKSPSVISKGRQYPVEIKYTGTQDEMMLPELTAKTVISAVEENEGDVLVFLPGEFEIRRCEEILRKALRGFAIHPLFGMLPQGKQWAAIMPDRNGKRKVVLATSIAETSLTIEGIRIVVDCGFGRTAKYDGKSALSRLETVLISQDSADQRAGRAGRLSSGVCYRMWTKASHERLREHRVPEIEESDLSSLVLDMAQWGISDINSLAWLSPPPTGAVEAASKLLHQLDALEADKITAHGKEIHSLPCHPRIAHMLIMAAQDDQLPLATDLAAILEERDPLGREAGIDINLRVEALRRFRREKLSSRKLSRIEKVASSYRRLFNIEPENDFDDGYDSAVMIVHAYPERIASARPGNNAQFQLANGTYAMAGHRDDLAHEAWLAVAHVDARQGTGKIFMAAALNPTDLAPLVKEREVITWDSKDGGLMATKDLRIGSIVLQSKPLSSPNPDRVIEAICKAIEKEGEWLLPFNDEVIQWQHRILSLASWLPEGNWPNVSTAHLLRTNSLWLAPYLNKVRHTEDLKKLNLLEILQNTLSYDQQQELDRLAPAKFTVPTGSKIKLKYKANGESPVLSIRLQEVFGMPATPTLANGKIAVVMQLLSPGFKPVQTTSDLASFWNTTYFEVKKEMKGRYPKHVWPDDPWNELPTKRTKRK